MFEDTEGPFPFQNANGPGEIHDRNLSCGEMRKPVNKAILIQQGDRAEENFLPANILFKLWQQNTSSTRLIQTPKRKESWGEWSVGEKTLQRGNFYFSF